MKLYLAPGACSLSPHIVLRELDLPFDVEVVTLGTRRTASGGDFLAINPKGYVPALELDDGVVLTEGVAIIQYLADHYAPGTLAPVAGTVERALLNGHLNFLSAELHKAFGPLFNPRLAGEAREGFVRIVERKLGLIEQGLAARGPYLCGSAFSIADVYLFVIAGWGERVGIDVSRWPSLQALLTRVGARPAAQAAMAKEAELRQGL